MAGTGVVMYFEGEPYTCKVVLPLKAFLLLGAAFNQLVPSERPHVVSQYCLMCEGAVVDPHKEINTSERAFALRFKAGKPVPRVGVNALAGVNTDVDTGRLPNASLGARNARTGLLGVTALPSPPASGMENVVDTGPAPF
jgi:hypothetical protein